MKKSLIVLLLLIGSVSFGFASVVQMGTGTYTTPQGYYVVNQVNDPRLSHDMYFTLGMNDLEIEQGRTINSIDIVFTDIFDATETDNTLSVYLFNGADQLGYNLGYDLSSPNLPAWDDQFKIGTWEYDHDLYNQPGERFDVVFTVDDPTLLAFLTDGGTFTIGIDPDCHYKATALKIVAPVPEPSMMIILGIGLIGFGGFARRKIKA